MNIAPKNLMVYRVNRDIEWDEERLREQLNEFAFVPCRKQEKSKFGWTPPFGKHGTDILHKAGNWFIFMAKKEVKNIPSYFLNEVMATKVEEMEKNEGRPLKKREKDNIKDDVIIDLLPNAFPKSTYTSVWVCVTEGLIVVDASSFSPAEHVLALLRKTIGSLPVVPAIPEVPVENTLTDWVKSGETPNGFAVLDEVELESLREEGGVIRCKKLELSSEDILNLIEENKIVTKLALDYQDRITFILSEKGDIKRVKFSDDILCQNEDIPREDQAARLDADHCLISGELEAFLPNLYRALGGLPEGQYQPEEKPSDEEPAVEKSLPETLPTSPELENKDSLLPVAKEFVAKTRRASVSGLQRKFKIGYNRAARIMDTLENSGIVSKPHHNGGRDVLIGSPVEEEE